MECKPVIYVDFVLDKSSSMMEQTQEIVLSFCSVLCEEFDRYNGAVEIRCGCTWFYGSHVEPDLPLFLYPHKEKTMKAIRTTYRRIVEGVGDIDSHEDAEKALLASFRKLSDLPDAPPSKRAVFFFSDAWKYKAHKIDRLPALPDFVFFCMTSSANNHSSLVKQICREIGTGKNGLPRHDCRFWDDISLDSAKTTSEKVFTLFREICMPAIETVTITCEGKGTAYGSNTA